MILLVNAGLDVIDTATIEVRAPSAPVALAMPGRKRVALRPRRTPGGWTVTLRDIAPWQVRALLIGK
jgi:hypothetical protein